MINNVFQHPVIAKKYKQFINLKLRFSMKTTIERLKQLYNKKNDSLANLEAQ